MSAPPIVYDAVKLAAAMRQHFPDMPEHVVTQVVNTGGEIAMLLANARNARLAAHGAEWQSVDCFGELLALFFNLTSMAHGGPEAQKTMSTISFAVRSVYGRGAPPVEAETEANPKLN
jgi:hypothetical protein